MLLMEKANRIITRFFASLFVGIFLVCGATTAANAACGANEIDVLGDGTQCETTRFSLTTTNTTDSFSFSLSAIGTFYVDCGTGGTLSSGGKTITRSDTTNTTYTCTYATAGAYTIKFGGGATNTTTSYNTSTSTAAISFNNSAAKIASVSGNLSSMFPYISGNAADGAQPRFRNTFRGATGLTSIPNTLFADYTSASTYMFSNTFSGCSGLTSLPADLFSKITTAASNMFDSTFGGCSNLAGYIPSTMFKGLIDAGHPTASRMFNNTFSSTQLMTSCPTGTTQFITGYEGSSTRGSELGGKVSCEQSSGLAVTLDNTGTDTPSSPTTVYLKYMDGWYSDSNATNAITGITLPTKSGYMFSGYYTGQNGNGARVINGLGNFITNNPQLTSATFYPYFVVSTAIETAKFMLTTTNTTNSFSFNLSAIGTFYVDWGDGDIETIVRNNTTDTTYTHNYSSADAYTIKFGGSATETTTSYNTSTSTAAISFYAGANNTAKAANTAKIASVSGNLSSMFPYITANAADGAQPRFYNTFNGAINLTSIPNTLFADYTVASTYMFSYTFYNCRGLTLLPTDLFSKITTSATGMFAYTFSGCSGLTSLPQNLFFPNATSVTGANYMFEGTFSGCSGLTSLPQNLFFPNATSVTGAERMFSHTFQNCSGLTSIPQNLFFPNATSVSGANYMFSYTFLACFGLTSLPENLFFPNATSVSGANYMFYNTFNGCTGLTSLPADLFSKITTAASNMFDSTFGGCSNLGGYIPPTMFKGLIDAGHPMAYSMFSGTFNNTQLVTSCPTGTTQFITGYEGSATNSYYFGGKVSCKPTNPMAITLDTTGATTSGSPATVYLTYDTKWTSDSAGNNTITTLTTLPTKTGYAFNGFWTGANGTGTQVIDGNGIFLTSPAALTFTMEPKTVYADFVPYTVMYECGTDATGTPPVTATVVGGEQFTPATNTCTKDGYMFTGWAVSGTNDVVSAPFTWNYSGDKTLTAQWTETKFSLTTTDTTNSFSFSLSAIGTFYVDWGDGDIEPIIRDNTTDTTYTHNYSTAGAYTIKFAGGATNTTTSYSTDEYTAAISFNNSAANIASVSGNLSSMFPMTSNAADGAQPRFYYTFNGATNLKSIPNTLFADYTVASTYMFYNTFSGCSGLTSLPQNLFFPNATSVTGAVGMFSETFSYCSGLTSLPADLFSKITTSTQSMFNSTFVNCSGLTSLPQNLFFPNATSVTGAESMFASTFNGCSGLTSLPANLFSKITTSADYMFGGTFSNCSGLTSLPADLFSKVTTSANYMFQYTFSSCSKLGGYIPPTMFKGLIDAGHPTANGMFSGTFIGTQLVTSCPTGTTQFITGYEGSSTYTSQFGGKVSCEQSSGLAVTLDNTGTGTPSSPTTVYLKYMDGWYSDSNATDAITGITAPTKSGYMFSGYYTEQNGNGTRVINNQGNFITNFITSTTLYPYFVVSTAIETAKFTLTTTNTTNSFSFSLSAKGTFYVDWGDGDIEPIVRDNTTNTTYTHNYSTAGAYTIKFAGGATNTTTSYNSFDKYEYLFGEYTGAISFSNSAAKIASVSGNLSSMFPYISGNAADGAQPRFLGTFYGATNLKSIPNTLFADYTVASTYMFASTFSGCSGLTSLPQNLFFPNATSVTGADNMFASTFSGCSGLTSLPQNLFFPNATSVTGAEGMFNSTFNQCRGLTSLPADLFSKITTSAEKMFVSTFSGCSGLTSLPQNLFFPNATSVTGASNMFDSTFSGCSGLTSIPANLFSKITTSAEKMFVSTFSGCSGLTSLPQNLFFPNATSVTGASNMFGSTFSGCSGLTSLPADLFSKITTSAGSMFNHTFQNCTGLTSIPQNLFFPNATSVTGADSMFIGTFAFCSGLTSIPADLFSKITTGANNMFSNTFYNCSGLTSLPADLFSKVTTSANYMFQHTFSGCSKLGGYIPPTMFKGLIDAGHPTEYYMFYGTFNNTQLRTSCPTGTTQFITGYEGSSTYGSELGGKVSCLADCGAGKYLPAGQFECSTCPTNSYCSGTSASYSYSASTDQGIASCASGLYSPMGMWKSAQCGRMLHIGDQIMYLYSTKNTTPALHFDIDNDGVADFFGNMTTQDVVMNSDTTRKLKIKYNNTMYSVYDDTVNIE